MNNFREFVRLMREWTTRTDEELKQLREFKATVEPYMPMLKDMKHQWDEFQKNLDDDTIRK